MLGTGLEDIGNISATNGGVHQDILKFPDKLWSEGNGTEFFLYASERRILYTLAGKNILLLKHYELFYNKFNFVSLI